MAPKCEIILLTAESQVVSAVSSALQLNGRFGTEGVCADVPSLAVRLERTPSAAVLVDIDPAPTRILAELDQLSRRHSGARFIVLSSEMNSELMLAAMQAGARHFVLKGAIGSDLSGTIQRLAPPASTAPTLNGAIIPVLSAGGGCGATTLAVNLAGELQAATSQPVLLADLDVDYGAAATYLGVQGPYGLPDVLAHKAVIDSQLIASTAVHHSSGIQVLLSPACMEKNAPLDESRLPGMLDACRGAYQYTVIDAPRVSMDTAAALAGAGMATFLVMQLTVKDVRMARRLVQELNRRGVPSSSLTAVISRYRSRHCMITQEEVQRALGSIQLAYANNEFSTAIRALNFGQLLAQSAPKTRLRRDIQAIATTLIRMSEKSLAGVR